jgi:hypothetical protein
MAFWVWKKKLWKVLETIFEPTKDKDETTTR